MIITFIRHAEVDADYIGKYNGHIDISLSAKGHLQANNLAKQFEDESFDAVYCSDLLRAKETLKPFKLKVKPIFTKLLREKSWGRHEGKSFEEIQMCGIKYINFEQWVRDLDGESIENYREKVRDFFYEVLLKTEAENFLVMTHAGFIKTVIGILNDKSLEESFQISLPYASIVKIDIQTDLV